MRGRGGQVSLATLYGSHVVSVESALGNVDPVGFASNRYHDHSPASWQRFCDGRLGWCDYRGAADFLYGVGAPDSKSCGYIAPFDASADPDRVYAGSSLPW